MEKQVSKAQPEKIACISSHVYLRVSNLKLPTKAADLKQLFNPCGKVLSVKILTSARTPGDCIGFLKMASAEEAAKCVKSLDGSEFNGRKIKVEATDKMPSSVSLKTAKNVVGPSSIEKSKAISPKSSRRYNTGAAVGTSVLYSVCDHDFGRWSCSCKFLPWGIHFLT